MKQLFGAVCAMVIGLGGLAMSPALAQQQSYRDHEGWYGNAPAGAPVRMAVAPAVTTRVAAAAARKPAPRRWVATKRRWTPPATRSYRQYKQVWFGNKIVWWPVTTTAPVARARTRTSSWRYASTRTPYRRWSNGHRVYWHAGYWTTNGKPGTMTPEPVYRYNPNGANPTIMNAPAQAKPAAIRRPANSKAYPGYQYYYYGKPVTSQAPGKAPTVAGRPQTRRNTAAAAPKDNIPTVYLYQRGHTQGIHLPPASTPAPEPPAAAPAAGAPGAAPGAAPVPGAPPAGGGLIPGAPAAPPVPQPPVVPAKP